jgi:putative hydrolase of the HAD superfamily
VEAVRRCHEHLHTGLLTNNFVALDGDGPVGGLLDLFDVVLESSRLGLRKPEPAFYELACERLDVKPDEAVFLDDLGVNLKPAKAMGMTTIKVSDPDTAIAELETVVGFDLR